MHFYFGCRLQGALSLLLVLEGLCSSSKVTVPVVVFMHWVPILIMSVVQGVSRLGHYVCVMCGG